MNISTGGPHILFFERDQQLTALLTSEFQLADYESHAARTAVEVFDTIARYPVRILLVNLAQAAAGRREFWVALDTQRRGRGVQVLTYRCSNLAGYGPKDPDERSQMMAPDLEIEGMLGLMNLVDAVRERVPRSSSVSSTTNTMPRIARVSPPPPNTPVLASSTAQQTAAQTNSNGTVYRAGQAADGQRNQASRAGSTDSIMSSAVPQTPPTGATGTNQQSYSEKIRAVLYPIQRPVSPQGNGMNTYNTQNVQDTYESGYNYDTQYMQAAPGIQNGAVPQSSDSDATMLQRLAYGQTEGEKQRESGLDQLSRMVQERRPLMDGETENGYSYQAANFASDGRSSTASGPLSTDLNFATTTTTNHASPVSQSLQAGGAIGTQPLRASPIEDLPIEQGANGQATGERRFDGSTRTGYSQYGGYAGQSGQSAANQFPTGVTTPLASISTLMPSAAAPPSAAARTTMPIPAVTSVQQMPAAPMQPASPTVAPPEPSSQVAQPVQPMVKEPLEEYWRGEDEGEPTGSFPAARQVEGEEENNEISGNSNTSTEQVQQVQATMQDALNWREDPKPDTSPNNAVLLDIMQSLPLMPSPPSPPTPQPTPSQAVNGRTMRSLGSVLLEGHLVPQSRLEVVQNVQRMLRGVDLNYQLGEILLMFKLLTPDQLLAASLVSYGMISTQQISALGRIRQELHSIGLEYDLESLLILFRMITPEQLREVRASWQG